MKELQSGTSIVILPADKGKSTARTSSLIIDYFVDIKPADMLEPKFYGQPKIHKPGAPICPIVSYSGSLLYNLNKYIANILKAYVIDENNSAKHSTTFFKLHQKCFH